MGKRLAAVGAAAAIGLGGFAVAAVNPLGVAGAQEGPAATAPAHRNGPLDRALEGLVADGTLTDAQAAKVKEAVTAAAKDGHQARQDRRTETLQVAADAIGSTPDEVKAGLKDGTSIAAQAEAKGVDRQVVDDALTTALTVRIDQAVEAGTITEERAAEAKGRLDELVDRILDADGSHRGHGSLRDRIQERRGN